MKMNEASIMKENITEVKSVMVSPNKEIAAMLESGNNLMRTNLWAFKFILKFFKTMFHLPNITSGHMIENILCTCILFWHILIKCNVYFTPDIIDSYPTLYYEGQVFSR